MLKAADDSLKALGLEEHQVIISCHRDEPQPHVHLIVNRTHPLTGVAAKLSRSKCKLLDFARVFERKEGTDYCPAREENHQKRKAGNRTKHGDPVIVNAWAKSNNGKEFVAALEAEVTHWQTAIGVLSSLIATEKRSTPFVSLKA